MATPAEVLEDPAQAESEVPEVEEGAGGEGGAKVGEEEAQDEETLPKSVVETMLAEQEKRMSKEVSAIQSSAEQRVKRAELASVQEQAPEGEEEQQAYWANFGRRAYANDQLEQMASDVGLTVDEVRENLAEEGTALEEATWMDVQQAISRMAIAKAEKIVVEGQKKLEKDREQASQSIADEAESIMREKRKEAGLDRVETSELTPAPEEDQVTEIMRDYNQEVADINLKKISNGADWAAGQLTESQKLARQRLMAAGVPVADMPI